MMYQLIQEVTGLVDEEFHRAAAVHGAAAHSPHEGYALIKEEYEEAQEQMAALNQQIDHYWAEVRADETEYHPQYLDAIKRAAILGACELIQVAAMADKALATYKTKEEQ